MMLLGWTTYLQMHRIGPKSVWEGLKKWIGEYGKAVGVDRNVGASFRSWSECKGTGFKRGPESWRDKLSKLTIKKTFFCFHTTNSVFFFEFCIPQKWGGGGETYSPSLFRHGACATPADIRQSTSIYVFVRDLFIYVVLDLFIRVSIPYLLLLYVS